MELSFLRVVTAILQKYSQAIFLAWILLIYLACVQLQQVDVQGGDIQPATTWVSPAPTRSIHSQI